MIAELKKIINLHYVNTVYTITSMRLKGQYQGSYFGIVWSLINPMAYAVVLSIVFSTIMRFPVKDYTLYVVPGIISWNFIINCINNSASSLIKYQGIIKRAVVSKTLFPTSEVALQTYLYFLSYFAIVILIKTVIVHNFSLYFVLFPIAVIPLLISVLSLSIGFAYVTPYFLDVPHLLSVVFNVLFWTIPIAYPIEIVPEAKRFLFDFHPVYILLRPILDVTYHNTLPSLFHMLTAFGVSLVCVIISYYTYKKLRKRVVYYI